MQHLQAQGPEGSGFLIIDTRYDESRVRWLRGLLAQLGRKDGLHVWHLGGKQAARAAVTQQALTEALVNNQCVYAALDVMGKDRKALAAGSMLLSCLRLQLAR
ncbi:hypothetical protein [Cupriavidus oxalaticus]|uniref:Uncharacterized protein n=1 Tax=Cupriavidus oxalaticus TaxID=96344 RepID=A0A4P7LS11_9BURK|nr:hypothetical protein [Cupriavidus oxalaticus]QBY56463.1 hypothetical protein E0W60_36390 [Cupriavidus oxalaticus]